MFPGKWKKFGGNCGEKMGILESCCGCGLAVSAAVIGVYLSVAYAIAFALESWWILDSLGSPPIPAYFLCSGYFILLTCSGLLLHGLSVKKTKFLLVWLFMMGILLGPEAGLVLYLSIHFWRVTSFYGLVEITCWACRLLVNGVGLVCVQRLYSNWREEKSVLLRLQTLKGGPVVKNGRSWNFAPVSGFQGFSVLKNKRPPHPEVSQENTPQAAVVQDVEDYVDGYVDPRYAEPTRFSEFNASSFDPTVIDARLRQMPQFVPRRPPSVILEDEGSESDNSYEQIPPRTRSLVDLSAAGSEETRGSSLSKREDDTASVLSEGWAIPRKARNRTCSLDRSEISKSKKLKILEKLSPFHSKKPTEVNIYQINPRNKFGGSNVDSKLNEMYKSRGMYTFDDRLKKVVFYPPEFFNDSNPFRSRMDSYGSNQSRSSVDTDSEDIRHISDVAL